MSITLATPGQEDSVVNVWNWGVLHDLVAQAGVFPEVVWAPKRYNGGGDLDGTQATTLAAFLEERVLPRLAAGERMFIDGTVTAAPDDGAIYRSDEDSWKNYSLRRDVLESVIAFLRAARGSVSFY